MFLEAVLQERARAHRIQRGVGLDLGSVEVELLAPYQPCLKTLLNDPLEEAPEDLQAVTLADLGEGGVVREGFV
jgi:hypothetical protein